MQVGAIVHLYSDAQITALKTALAGIAIFALVALWYVRNLPTRAAEQSGSTEPAEEDATAAEDAAGSGKPATI